MGDLTLMGDSASEWFARDEMGVAIKFAPGRAAKDSYLGFVYLLEFDTGVIKVGKAVDPRRRLQAHKSSAEAMGRRLVAAWVSRPHGNYAANERALIASFTHRSSQVIRAEYFVGVGITEARRIAQALPFEPRNHRQEAHDKARAEALMAVWDPGVDRVWVSQAYVDAAERWLRFDRSAPLPNGTPRTVTDPSEVDTPPFVDRDSETYRLLEQIADAKGVDVEEVADWSYIDIIGDLLATQALTAKHEWTIFAYENGRDDLLCRPWVELDPSEAS